jgi:hypothetical protein
MISEYPTKVQAVLLIAQATDDLSVIAVMEGRQTKLFEFSEYGSKQLAAGRSFLEGVCLSAVHSEYRSCSDHFNRKGTTVYLLNWGSTFQGSTLFMYENGSFITENFNDAGADVTLHFARFTDLTEEGGTASKCTISPHQFGMFLQKTGA